MPDYVNTSSAQIEQELISYFEEKTGTTADPGSPERLIIAWMAAALTSVYAKIRDSARQNIPAYATGENLDILAEMLAGLERPTSQPAVATQRFYIPEEAMPDYDITIPAGTRVTNHSGSIYFATVEDAVIESGTYYVDTMIRCTTLGEIGNGYAEGQLNTIVDVYEFYSNTGNIDMTAGGSDAASDEQFRKLFALAQNAFSTAGSRSAYEYFARSVSREIEDVKIVNPRPSVSISLPLYNSQSGKGGIFVARDLVAGTIAIENATIGYDYTVGDQGYAHAIVVNPTGSLKNVDVANVSFNEEAPGHIYIYATTKGGVPANSAIKALILAKCSSDDVRPITDKVEVHDPANYNYSINMTYYIDASTEESAEEISEKVNNAVDEYVAWQSAKMGRDINPSKLTAMIMSIPSIKRVSLTSPMFHGLKDGSDGNAPQLAHLTSRTVTSGGREGE